MGSEWEHGSVLKNDLRAKRTHTDTPTSSDNREGSEQELDAERFAQILYFWTLNGTEATELTPNEKQ